MDAFIWTKENGKIRMAKTVAHTSLNCRLPRIAPLIVGNIVLNYLRIEQTVVVVVNSQFQHTPEREIHM